MKRSVGPRIKSERAGALVKREENTNMTDAISIQYKAVVSSSLDPNMKIEEKDENHKSQIQELDNESGSPLRQTPASNYCQVCDHRFSSGSKLRRHLGNALHKRKSTAEPPAPSNVFDPNNYCRTCNRVYKKPIYYRVHLRRIHRMDLIPPPKPTLDFRITTNPDDPNNYCASCKRTFKTKDTYRSHFEIVHNMVLPRSQRSTHNPDILPDIDDPIYYCKSCQTTYKSRWSYRTHLKKTSTTS